MAPTASVKSTKYKKLTYMEERAWNIAKNNALLGELGLLGGFGELVVIRR